MAKVLSVEPTIDPSAWWDWDHDKLREALPNFRKLAIEDFLGAYEAGASYPFSKRSAVA